MNTYLKYTGLAFQLLFLMAAGYYLGHWLGPKAGMSVSNGEVLGLMIFLLVGLYRLIKEVMDESR